MMLAERAINEIGARSLNGANGSFCTRKGMVDIVDVMSPSVRPSGADFATSSIATMLLLPGRGTTGTSVFQTSRRRAEIGLERASVAPPGGNGVMMRTGSPAGHSFAADHEGVVKAAQTPATKARLSMTGRQKPDEPTDLDLSADMVIPLSQNVPQLSASLRPLPTNSRVKPAAVFLVGGPERRSEEHTSEL